ncbi:MAG TPA: HPr family phosphocarrier protein [Terriglobia bacterium]|jgi:phosphocarrier protein
MKEREVVVSHRLGLHARAAAKLVQLSSQFQCNIVLFRADGANVTNPAEADARSILSILLLSAGYGSKLGVRADGADEEEAVNTICEYLTG